MRHTVALKVRINVSEERECDEQVLDNLRRWLARDRSQQVWNFIFARYFDWNLGCDQCTLNSWKYARWTERFRSPAGRPLAERLSFISLNTPNISIIWLGAGLSHPEWRRRKRKREKTITMRIQLFPGLLLVLFFLFSFVGTCPLLESERLCPFFQIPPIPLSPPSEAVPIVHNSVVFHNTLKFERYSKWIKDQSKYFWKSREDCQDVRDYVSPYLTKFEAKKKAGWWASLLNLIRLWRHFLWEMTLPEWLGCIDTRIEWVLITVAAMCASWVRETERIFYCYERWNDLCICPSRVNKRVYQMYDMGGKVFSHFFGSRCRLLCSSNVLSSSSSLLTVERGFSNSCSY